MSLLPEEGLEPSLPCENGILNPASPPANTALAPEGAQKGAKLSDSDKTDSQLAVVNTAWASLPDHIKAAILALVNSAKEGK